MSPVPTNDTQTKVEASKVATPERNRPFAARFAEAATGLMGLSSDKKLTKAQEAYVAGDIEACKKLHDAATLQGLLSTIEDHEEPQMNDGGVVKPLVFGGLDGIITTFAVVAGAIGAQLSITQVLIMGFANLLADAFSMGFGEYISSKAELEYNENEYKRETWEFEHHPDGELKEMVDIYVKKGISEEDACVILSTLSKYKEPFVDHMMVEELGLMPPDADENPLKQGLVMFSAFILFGALPLTGLVAVMSIVGKDDAGDYQNLAFGLSCGLTAITLMCLGAVKARYTKQNMLKSALLMLMNGTISGGAAFAVGEGLNHLFG